MNENITAAFQVDGDKPMPKQHDFIMLVLRIASESQQLQLCRQRIIKLEEDTPERRALAEKIEVLEEKVKTNFMYFFVGGAIRGGKSVLCSTIIILLCKFFPGSRWHVIRKSNKNLQTTILKTIEGLLRYSEGIYWKRGDKEYFAQFPNGSRIYFTSEAYDSDKQLTKFLGIEMNGVFFDQLEELREETYTRVLSRLGSYYLKNAPMPPIIMLASFNPTYNWLKTKIYDKWKKGELESPYYFLELLPKDNPHVTEDQWKSWQNLPDDEYKRMIEGQWDLEVKKQFCYGFTDARNIARLPMQLDYRFDVIVSFDFNVDPMTAIIAQTDYETFIHVKREFRIPDSDTYAMCDAIRPFIQGYEHIVVITGDASGKNRMSGTKGHINHYQIIKENLNIGNSQFKIPSVNPNISDSRVFINALLQRLKEFTFDPSCEHTIKDMKFVLVDLDRDGNVGIKKTGMNEYLGIDNKEIGHLCDCLRYLVHATFTNWLQIPKS